MAQAAGEQTDQPMAGRRPLSLTIPCKAEYVALCRLVVGTLGAHAALDEEAIADLKVVVTEACNCFLGDSEGCTPPEEAENQAETTGQNGPPPSLRVDFYISLDAWEIVVFDPDRRHRISPASLCDPMSGGGLGLTIIQALVDSIEHAESEAEGSVIRLVKRIPSHPSGSD